MTRVVPKELLPYQDRPLIQHILEELHDAGIRQVVLVTRPDKALLRRHLADPYPYEHRASCPAPIPAGMELRFVEQPRADGLVGALRAARPELSGEAVLLAFPDQMLEGRPGASAQLLEAWAGEDSLSALVRIPSEEAECFPGARGLDVEGEGPTYEVTGLLGDETPSRLRAEGLEVRGFGRTVLAARFFEALPEDPADEAYGLAFAAFLGRGRHRAHLLEGRPLDLGTREGYRFYAGGRR